MRVLGSWLLLAVLLIPAHARAGDHRADVRLSSSFISSTGSTIHLGGWHVSGGVTLKKLRKLSFVGDVSTHFFGSDDNLNVTQMTFLVGPRWTFIGGKKNMPFVHFMPLGAVHRSEGTLGTSTTVAAFAVGVGHDFVPPKEGQWGVCGEIDFIRPWEKEVAPKKTWRFSLGFVYRFHDPHSQP